MYEGMFKLNINNKNNVVVAYFAESSISYLWHNYLGHINFRRMRDMVKMELILDFGNNSKRYRTCMLTKIIRNPFSKVNKCSKLLKLIHSDVCDFHSTPSMGEKKYFVTFIDNYSRFCYIYLLHFKDYV